jgi:hypothetical protein
MSLWLSNTDGKKDAILTLAVVSVAVVLAKVLLAGVVIKSVNLGTPPGADVIAALLTPTLGAYVARRWGDAKFSVNGTVPNGTALPKPEEVK